MAAYVPFQPAKENLVENINAGSDSWVLKLATVVSAAAGTMTETTNGNGYTTGGVALTVSSSAQSGGTYTLTFNTPSSPTWTATGAGFTFQYVVLTNSTTSTNVAYWDYGSSQAVASGETVTVTLTNAFTLA